MYADATKEGGAWRDTDFIQKCNIMDGTVKQQQLDTTTATYQHCTQQQFMMYTLGKNQVAVVLLCMFHTVKKLFDIPVPSRDVTYQTLPARE